MPESLELFIPPEDIRAMVKRLAAEIKADCSSTEPILVGVLKGASVLLSDLIRELDCPLQIDFVQTSSYGTRDTPAEQVSISTGLSGSIAGRDVVVVDGIIDRGKTVETLLEYLHSKGPASVRICTLLLREGSSAKFNVDYIGATIGAGFVVGYGMDYMERYRNLPAIYLMPEDS